MTSIKSEKKNKTIYLLRKLSKSQRQRKFSNQIPKYDAQVGGISLCYVGMVVETYKNFQTGEKKFNFFRRTLFNGASALLVSADIMLHLEPVDIT